MASAAGETSGSKTVRLAGSDGKEVVVEEAVAMRSQMLRNMLEEDICAGDVIPVPNVSGAVLSRIFDYCKEHIGDPASDDCDFYFLSNQNYHKDFDDKFLDVDMDAFYDLLMAANYLAVKDLLKLLCKKVAGLIRGKSPEEIRRTFNIQNDLTPEEEGEIRMKNPWAFRQKHLT